MNDGEFQRFQELFNKYQEQLAKTPSAWAKVSKENAVTASNFERIAAALMAQNRISHEAAEANKAQAKHLTLSERLWTSMAHSTKDVAKSILGATEGLLKWSGILGAVGGLLGAGGLWGIDRMAMAAAGQRSSGMGLGMSTGAQKAFNINFGGGRLLDNADAFLDWVNQMETDRSKQGPAYALTRGVGLSGDTEKDALRLMKGIRTLAQQTELGNLGTIMGGFGAPLSSAEQRRFKTMGNPEYGGLFMNYAKDATRLNTPDDIGKKWADFTQQMERAGQSIFNTFVKGLAPLADPLAHLSAGIVKFTETLLKSDLVKDAINNLASWLEKFSGTISAPAFLDDVKTFTSDVGDLADAIHTITHPGQAIANFGSNIKSFFAPTPDDLKSHPGLMQRYMGRLDSHFDLPTGLVETVKALENSAANAVSPKGAMGVMQLMPGTAAQYGATNPFDPVQNLNAGAKYLAHLEDRYHGDIAKVLAAYNYGEGRLDKLISEHPKDWGQQLPRETRQYLMNANPLLAAYGSPIRVDVTIHSPPGTSATATVNALAH